MGVGLGEQILGLLLEGLDGVGAGGQAQRRLVLSSASWTSAAASLAGSPPCWPFMPFQAATVCVVFSA